MLLRDDRLQVFERDGVVQLGRVLSADEVADLRERVDGLMFHAKRPVPLALEMSETVSRPPDHSVLILQDAGELDEAIGSLARRPDFFECMSTILGPRIQLAVNQVIYKLAERGGELEMHQDIAAWKFDPPRACTIWIALDDATEESGCVHFVRGSHRDGLIEHRPAWPYRNQTRAQLPRSQSTPYPVAAGCATLHDAFVAHWSSCNTSSVPRRAITVAYRTAAPRR